MAEEELRKQEEDGRPSEEQPEDDRNERERLGRGFRADDKGSRFSRERLRLTRKKTVLGLLVPTIITGGGFMGFSIMSGPAQFVQLSSFLEKVHLGSLEDFGDDRGSKLLLYALLGRGTENGRLGATMNKAADKWEKAIENKAGLKPVYTQRTGRFVGYEISNLNRFHDYMGELDDKNSETIERLMGDGAEIRTASEIRNSGTNRQTIVGGSNRNLEGNTRIIDLSGVSFRDRRVATRTINSAIGANRVVAGLASRLQIKRFGIDFHPLKNIVRRENDRAEYRTQVLKQWVKNIKSDTRNTRTLNNTQETDDEGNPVQSDEAKQASDEANRIIDEGANTDSSSSGESNRASRVKLLATAGGAAVVGMMCAVHGAGEEAEERNLQNAKEIIKIGKAVGHIGNQVKGMEDANLDEMGVYSDLIYDADTETSYWNAKSMQAEAGEPQTGPDISPAAKPTNGIPGWLSTIKNNPLVSGVCGVLNAVGNLPILKQVGDVASKLQEQMPGYEAAKDYVFAFITNTEVDPVPRGAEGGSTINYGYHLAAADSWMSSGGAPLSDAQVAAIKADQATDDALQNESKSFFARYLDPYEYESVGGSVARATPTSNAQVASMVSNLPVKIGSLFSKTFSAFLPTTYADEPYDYGVPKYGFTLEEQADGRFENPYENAKIIEDDANGNALLNSLNDKYGSKCFGVKAVVDGGGVKLENGDPPNVVAIQGEDDCNPAKNSDPNFLRYRFYIADLVSAKSTACYFADDDTACNELGAGSVSSDTATGNSTPAISGSANMQQAITVSDPGKFITMPSKYSCDGRETRIDSRIAPALAYIIDTYKLCAHDGLANGHRSHGAGLGVDLVPRDDPTGTKNDKEIWKNSTEKLARDMGWWGDAADQPKSNKGCANYSGYGQCMGSVHPDKIPKWVRWIGYNGDVDHGDPWHIFGGSYGHIHLGWDTPNSDGVAPSIISSPRSEVYTFTAPIPADLKDLL